MKKESIIYHFIGAIILMLPALYNGFPLVYSDTGTYLESGHSLIIPKDRPIFYGLFLRIASLHFSLWIALFVQAFVSVYCYFRISRLVLSKLSMFMLTIALVPLSIGSPFGWYASQLMPDIWTFVGVSSIVFLLYDVNTTSWNKWVSVLLLVLSTLFHYSNLLIFLLLIFSFCIFEWKRIRNSFINRTYLPILAMAFVIITAFSVNYLAKGKLKFSNGSHVFLMGRLLDNGVLDSFLADNCTSNKYKMCAFKDKLPEDSRAFLWDTNSPLYQLGGWEGSAREFNTIIKKVLISPKYIFMWGTSSISASLTQLLQNDMGSGIVSEWYSQEDSPPYRQIANHYPYSLRKYLQSRQNTNLWNQGLSFKILNAVYIPIWFLSTLFIVVGLVWGLFKKYVNGNGISIVKFLLLSIVLNAIVVATLANVYDRLQARISWVVVLIPLLLLTGMIDSKIKKEK